MEVKIKTNNEMIDATIEMVDGVMVVSPKNVYVPKDGDVVVNGRFIFIYNDCLTAEAYYYCGMNLTSHEILFPDGGHFGYVNQLRPATEEEKKKLFDKLKEEGYEFDFEKKELIKLKWKPKSDGIYYYPSMKPQKGRIISYPKKERNTGLHFDKEIIDTGWVFKTQEECQEFCNRLNSYISSIKP